MYYSNFAVQRAVLKHPNGLKMEVNLAPFCEVPLKDTKKLYPSRPVPMGTKIMLNLYFQSAAANPVLAASDT